MRSIVLFLARVWFLPALGNFFNWAGFGSAVSNIGSAVTQSLAQAGVFGSSAQSTALKQPLAPPAAGGGQTAYTAQTIAGISSPVMWLLIGLMAMIVLIVGIRTFAK